MLCLVVIVALSLPATAREPMRLACNGIEAQVGSEHLCLQAMDTFKDCPNCPEMVVVPAGQFTMGSPSRERGRSDDEGPQHEVCQVTPRFLKRFSASARSSGSCRFRSDLSACELGLLNQFFERAHHFQKPPPKGELP
jgi:hypothetical protein